MSVFKEAAREFGASIEQEYNEISPAKKRRLLSASRKAYRRLPICC